MSTTLARARAFALTLGDVPRRLAALGRMDAGELAQTYRALYGEPTRSRNKEYLRKRLAWRIQELAEGGLSEATLAKIVELGDGLPERWRRRLMAEQPLAAQAPMAQASTVQAPAAPALPPPAGPRDARLPPPGTVLRRVYQGVAHEVEVLAEGFLYAGERFKTLSAVAKRITGTPWNGYLFFQMPPKASSPAVQAEARP